MPVVTMVLVFLLAVVVSGFIARLLPFKVPLPLLQIAIGAGLAMLGFDVDFEPRRQLHGHRVKALDEADGVRLRLVRRQCRQARRRGNAGLGNEERGALAA